MTENTYYKPRLLIGDKEVLLGMSGSLSFPGNNQAHSLSCAITDPEIQNARLFNQEIKLYLNYGSDDGAPIFRGFIKSVTPSDKDTKIKAIDGRAFINSDNSKMIELTDDNNYDGYTLAAFLYDYINTHINGAKTYIGLDALKDTNPSISMSGIRNEPTPVYNIVTDKLKKAIDESDIENPLTYSIDMIDDGIKSNITFIKEKLLTDLPSINLTRLSGIISYSYNRRAPANFAVGGSTTFTYGNAPLGSIGMAVDGDFKDKNEARQELIKSILLQYRETDEISVKATKGHYINIGSIVRLQLDDEDISGNHRLTSKTINFSPSRINLTLKLNKKPAKLADYL